MNDRDHARQLLAMAGKDSRALEVMCDPRQVDGEIFGFHAQQAVEKALKAWVASLGAEYPLTHNLASLVCLLRDRGGDVSGLEELESLTPFAVRLRYEQPDLDETIPLDRPGLVGRIRALIERVEKLVRGV